MILRLGKAMLAVVLFCPVVVVLGGGVSVSSFAVRVAVCFCRCGASSW